MKLNSGVLRLVRSALDTGADARTALVRASEELGRLKTIADQDQAEWLGASAAARYLGLPSRKALYQAVRRGQVPFHRFGSRRMRFRRIDLDQVLQRGRQTPALDSR
jgi:excisionase family DNA binding protein